MPRERSKRTVGHLDLFADFERDRRLGPLDAVLGLINHRQRLRLRDRHRLIVGAKEPGHLRRVLDQHERRVGHFHLHEHVAGQQFLLRLNLSTPLDFDDMLGRHHDLIEQMVHAASLGTLADALGHLALEVRIGVNNVPALCHQSVFRIAQRLKAAQIKQ